MLLKTLIARAFVWASKSLSQSKRSPTRFNWGYEPFVAGLYHGDFHHLTWDVYPSSVPLFFRCGEVGIPTQSWSCFNGRTLDGLWTDFGPHGITVHVFHSMSQWVSEAKWSKEPIWNINQGSDEEWFVHSFFWHVVMYQTYIPFFVGDEHP